MTTSVPAQRIGRLFAALVARARAGRVVTVLTGAALLFLGGASTALASAPIITQFAGTGTRAAPIPGSAIDSPLGTSYGAVVDSSGNLYIADEFNCVVEKVTPGGTLSIVAGIAGSCAPITAGPAISSQLDYPYGIAVDSSGNLYIADDGDNTVEKVTPGGAISTIAGDGSYGAPTQGPALSSPMGTVYGLAADSAGNVYIADYDNNVVAKVTPGGTLSIIAGNGTSGSPTPGPATDSEMENPDGLAVDSSGNVYIADYDNSDVEKVTPGGILSIVAGTPGSSGIPTAGPATSTVLGGPEGLVVDSSGDLYIADEYDSLIEKVTPSGTLSIVAGVGAYGAPTYGNPATSSHIAGAQGLVVNADGTFYIDDTGNHTVDRIGFPVPGPPGQPMLSAGNGSAQYIFTPPSDWGTSAITSYQVSLDGGATWTTITTTPGPNGTVTATLSGLTYGTTYSVLVRAVNSSGPGAPSPSGQVTPPAPAPTNQTPPAILGSAGVGKSITCTPGTWTGAGRYTYQWLRDGAPIPGATAPSYTPASADQGHTLTCTVIAYSSAGTTSQSTSAGVLIPIVNVSLCPQPTGRLSGTQLGPIWLGMARRRVRRLLPRYRVYSPHTDNFCLAGGSGIRVGYATRHLLSKLPDHPHAQGIVLALTANPYYALDGIRPGSSLRAAAARLAVGRPIHWGSNWWYVIPGQAVSWVLKVQHGTVREIGIASHRLTTNRPDQTWLLSSF